MKRGVIAALFVCAAAYADDSCNGLARIASRDEHSVTIEKLAKGPLSPPILIMTTKGASPVMIVFDNAAASAEWENGGTFRQSVDVPAETTVELRCSSTSPYHAAAVPDGVVYKRIDDKVLNDAVAKISALLRSEKGFGSRALYDDMVLIGPGLFPGVKDDADLARVKSPRMVTIDPETNESRGMLRVMGDQELALLGPVLRRYLGDTPLRIRAATANELAEFWLNIGWDIDEPLLIVQVGARRLVLDVDDGKVAMLDELHR